MGLDEGLESSTISSVSDMMVRKRKQDEHQDQLVLCAQEMSGVSDVKSRGPGEEVMESESEGEGGWNKVRKKTSRKKMDMSSDSLS
ncbi:hypothetical protein F7725_021726 [Dissostichus mawsoni]|uniref:Uncharacterized protein n=1 Tax=Dissostichus mawsoni TaxID=36200 RepID=A0A7J5ZFB8_DISMA|nr:hypothetical protein F7725_021726 [Dissostichus mawsoni]